MSTPEFKEFPKTKSEKLTDELLDGFYVSDAWVFGENLMTMQAREKLRFLIIAALEKANNTVANISIPITDNVDYSAT